ncbi:uncharacterized protein LOC122724392 [Manihot esculenta]|uniref:uncharacterized protein LOC122724392 n=1 Tax=Manihot esculenta TaxID=3983 RepID=UPI001CC4D4A3|nr:uncharacterized protein LOC122724392 [Manihot esculenta]
MPSTVLNGNTPYNVLFPKKLLFPLEPRLFDSTCYVRNVKPHVTKLDSKALKCVFLGYSRLQKGYRCYSPDLNKYLVSTDIVFSEKVSFYPIVQISLDQEDDDEWLIYRIISDGGTFSSMPSAAQSDGNIPPNTQPPINPSIIQVYSRKPVPDNTCPAPESSSPSDPPPTDLDLPISLRKDSISLPKTVKEALAHSEWRDAIFEEIKALDENHTWELVDLPSGKKVVGWNDSTWISSLKNYLHVSFRTKDLGQLKYFLGVQVLRSKKGIFLSQMKYVLDLLAETGKMGAKSCSTTMILIYVLQKMTETLMMIQRGTPGLGILYRDHGYTTLECFSDADWAGSKSNRKSTTSYCVFVGGNLVSWKSKKQNGVSRSSVESEYSAMAQSSCEILWINNILKEVGMNVASPAKL